MDLRDIRTTFLEKKLAYACSYYASLRCRVTDAVAIDSGLRAGLRLLQGGKMFHVLDRDRVMGADGHDHDVPRGTIKGVDESILFQREPEADGKEAGGKNDGAIQGTCGIVDGRMTIETAETMVDVTYNGVLQLAVSPRVLFDDDDALSKVEVHGKAFIVPSFETMHPKYHWLVERACIAFGVWKAKARNGSGDRDVLGRFDVYSAD